MSSTGFVLNNVTLFDRVYNRVLEGIMVKARTLSFIIIQEGDWLSAQCLEHDIATQAKTYDDLIYEIGRNLIGQVNIRRKEGLPSVEEMQPAPESFRDYFLVAFKR
jgi:hypothetical protein